LRATARIRVFSGTETRSASNGAKFTSGTWRGSTLVASHSPVSVALERRLLPLLLGPLPPAEKGAVGAAAGEEEECRGDCALL
jgi:hypothetical protein